MEGVLQCKRRYDLDYEGKVEMLSVLSTRQKAHGKLPLMPLSSQIDSRMLSFCSMHNDTRKRSHNMPLQSGCVPE